MAGVESRAIESDRGAAVRVTNDFERRFKAKEDLSFTIYHFSFCHWWIQRPSATVELGFAPAERDVYSYKHTQKDFAPVGAKPAN